MLGPTGAGAHIQVHSQIRATFSGTVPTPGSVAVSVKSAVLNASRTSAVLAPMAWSAALVDRPECLGENIYIIIRFVNKARLARPLWNSQAGRGAR